MTKYYDVTLTNTRTNNTVSYVADSFSLSDDRILRIYSKKFGNVTTLIENYEELSIKELKGVE